MPSHSDLHLALGSFLQTISSVPRFPVEDDKIRASAVTKRRGGNTPNTIDVLEQLCAADQKTEPTIDLSLVVVLPNSSSSAVQEIGRSFGPGVDLTRSIYRGEHTEASSSYHQEPGIRLQDDYQL